MAIKSDPWYNIFLNKNEIYWSKMPQKTSPEFKDLINKMLAVIPDSRLNMEQLKAHPWL